VTITGARSIVRVISRKITRQSACHTDGSWLIRPATNEKEIQTMQTTLANLKAKTEEAAKRH
jgi:hypothetical protein